MEYVLWDIKNFLKKLENGQLEIEAGQWELHKDLTNMKIAIKEIKNIKEDVEKMRLNSVEQMNLIKALQDKIETFQRDRTEEGVLTLLERNPKYEKVYKRPLEGLSSSKGCKKRKSHLIRSEEIIEITSQITNEKSDLDQEETNSKIGLEEPVLKASDTDENQNNSETDLAESLYREPSQIEQFENKSGDKYSYSTSNDILQRYLIDSAKYVEKKTSSPTEITHGNSGKSRSEKSLSGFHNAPFWDEYGSRAPEKRTSEYKNQDSSAKENSSVTRGTESKVQKKLECPKCSRQFTYKVDFLRHKREHQRAEAVRHCKICGKGFCGKLRLREHQTIHKISSRNAKGFKCSYCKKICSTPETLTSHLRKCRVIMRHHFKRK